MVAGDNKAGLEMKREVGQKGRESTIAADPASIPVGGTSRGERSVPVLSIQLEQSATVRSHECAESHAQTLLGTPCPQGTCIPFFVVVCFYIYIYLHLQLYILKTTNSYQQLILIQPH